MNNAEKSDGHSIEENVMSDDLSAWLRQSPAAAVDKNVLRAADALEDKDRQIAELIGNREAWKGIQQGTADLLKEKEAQIAELKAALKPFAMKIKLLDNGMLDDGRVVPFSFEMQQMRTARGAYEGAAYVPTSIVEQDNIGLEYLNILQAEELACLAGKSEPN